MLGTLELGAAQKDSSKRTTAHHRPNTLHLVDRLIARGLVEPCSAISVHYRLTEYGRQQVGPSSQPTARASMVYAPMVRGIPHRD